MTADPGLRGFIDAAPQPQRTALRLLIALGRRPRGAWILHRIAPADQLANGLAVGAHFEEAGVAVKFGWDADAVAARGRALRRAEGRP
jgi:hypothetical protein